ncbi:hypothetical protein [Halobacterium sp. CBA1126]|uniref:hypothetical protein n=1 Tax=Halobacterium sp. CBA1126 TaxID=2668074 RepID=UPI0012F90481|nr:hypothetical protein [Halobacterium sp. CBA1126]MUV59976.1 hypothetical protein [Halobacterium sp. CBA1126]
MTGAGAASVAWAPETSYLGGTATDPTYREPGSNIQVEDAELSRNLLEIYAPNDPETQALLAQNLEGQLSISWILTNDEFHRLIFNDGNTGFTSGLANSAEVYLGVDYSSATTERQLKGWAPASVQIQYNGPTETVRVTVTGAYGDEVKNTSLTAGTISKTGDEVPGHGASLTINGVAMTKLQSATLSFENISRLQLGPSQKPVDAVTGNVSTSVDITSIYDGPEQYSLALGSSGATSVQQDVGEVSASLTFDVAGSEVASYDIAGVAPDTYNWQDLVNPDNDLQESVNFLGHSVTGSDPAV